MRIQELCADALTAPVRRIAAPDIRMPASPVLQSALIPGTADIVRGVRELLASTTRTDKQVNLETS